MSLRRAASHPVPAVAVAADEPRRAPGDEAATVPAREARSVADRAILRACFGPLALGYLVAVCCGAALAWDSGGIFFQLLDTRAPVTPNQRWVNAVAQLPALLASRVTDNLAVLGFLFGASWALLPLGALAAAWLLIRRRAPELFVWPVLAVGLGLLPGLFYLGTEADIALVLVWPLFLALVLGVARPLVPVVAACAALLAISHPYAIGLFALLAALALLLRLREGGARRELVGWALAYGLLAGLTALRFLLFHTGYERDQLTRGALAWNFLVALRGYPAAALGGTAVAALLALALPHVGRRAVRRALRVAQALALLVVAVCLVLWARDPHLWAQANKYGYPALPITLGFLALALLDRARLRAAPGAAQRAWGPRLRTIGQVAPIAALVLSVQGAAWFGLTQQFRRAIATSPAACIAMAPLGWLRETPLDAFSTPAYALLLQGRTPARLVLAGNGCGAAEYGTGVALNQFSTRGWQGGWFDLAPLHGALLDQRQHTGVCSFVLTTGWDDTETSDPYWWRWSDGQDAHIRILAAADGQFLLNGQVESYRSPNRVTILVNGVAQEMIAIARGGQQTFSPITLSLKGGVNDVRLVGDNPAQLVGERSLNFDVANLTLTRADTGRPCDFRP